MKTYSSSIITQGKLIEATGRLAAEYGFNKISTRMIATAAKENIGSISYHFGNKENLFIAVLKKVIEPWHEFPVEKCLQDFDLEGSEGQARALRELIKRKIDILFRRENPLWYSRVLYQVMQYRSPLQDFVQENLITSEQTIVMELFTKIQPALLRNQTQLHFLLMSSPIFMHANYMQIILKNLEMDKYSDDYLNEMENIIATQTQLFFKLPLL